MNQLTTQPPPPDRLQDQSFAFAVVAGWRILRKYWATAFVTTLAISLGVAFFTLGQKRIYRASATILFDPTPPRPLGKDVEAVVDMGASSYWDNHEYYETQFKVIQSMRMAESTVKELGLNTNGGFIADAPPGAITPPAQVSVEDAAQILRGRIGVDPIKDSRLATVRYDDADPQRARSVLTRFVERYVEQNLDDAVDSTSSAVDWLRSQLDKLKGDLESNELALHEFKMNKNILSVAFDDQSNMLRDEMKQLNEVLTSLHTKREEISARANSLAGVTSENPSELPSTELLQAPLLQQIRTHYEEAIRERDALLGSGKGKNHPDVQAADAKVSASKDALLAEVKNIRGSVGRDLAVVKEQEAGLSALFEKAKKQALELNLLEIEYNRLRRSKDNTEKLYNLVLERTKESDLTRMMRVNNIRIIDKPLLPGGAIRPRVTVNIALGVVMGCVFGLAAALMRAALDRTLKTPEDVEGVLGISFLGLLPEIGDDAGRSAYYSNKRRRRSRSERRPTSSRELIVHEFPSSGVAEASRSIRTNIMFMSPDQPFRTLLVTSAGPMEGKTTVACCIAIAMAQAGQKVVLVDCDLRRPRIHRVFGKGSDRGVTTSLLEGAIDDAPQPTDVPNLSVIPAGPLPPNPAELVQSERFKAALKALASRFDRVIIDSPPLVPVTDAAILSMFVDGTVLVVKGYSTKKDLARQALRSLEDVGAKTAGAVLNAINLNRHEYKYSHYYYKRDGYYASGPTNGTNGTGGASGSSSSTVLGTTTEGTSPPN